MIINGCILLVLAGSSYFYWLVNIPNFYCNMRCKWYSYIWCASNSLLYAMRCKWYNKFLLFNISRSRSIFSYNRYIHSILLFNRSLVVPNVVNWLPVIFLFKFFK
jgi:hypothetical protein